MIKLKKALSFMGEHYIKLSCGWFWHWLSWGAWFYSGMIYHMILQWYMFNLSLTCYYKALMTANVKIKINHMTD